MTGESNEDGTLAAVEIPFGSVPLPERLDAFLMVDTALMAWAEIDFTPDGPARR